ncbi:MAG: PilZ domain-containing protein [Gammaproteobacteria bacterium]
MPPRESTRSGRAIVPIAPETDARLGVEVRAGCGQAHAGEVTDVPRGGVGMRFPEAHAPQLPVGKPVILALTSAHLGKTVELPAMVLSRVETEAFRRYRFQFNGQAAHSREVAKEFYRLFNRRNADRVEPRLDERVEVQIEIFEQRHGRSPLTVALKNISATGMGIVAAAEVDYLLADVERVRARIRLPTRDTALSLVAWIRSRALEGNSIAYAVQFDPQRSRAFCAQQEAIMDYVMGRLMEELQNTVG